MDYLIYALTGFLCISIFVYFSHSSEGTQAKVSNAWGNADVKLITLNDGTKCAVLIGYGIGSINCNWK
jgi:hypothetical protein